MNPAFTNAEWIAVISSIAAWLTALATFLTVRQIARQRAETFRPELAPSRVYFTALPSKEGGIPSHWQIGHNDEDELADVSQRGLNVPLHNLGLGPAKDVRITWNMPVDTFVQLANELAQRALVQAFFEYKNEVIDFRSGELGKYTSLWANQKKQEVDFILPFSTKGASIPVSVPLSYIQLLSSIVYFSWCGDDKQELPRIPTAEIVVEFNDIAQITYRRRFKVAFELAFIIGKADKFGGTLVFSRLDT